MEADPNKTVEQNEVVEDDYYDEEYSGEEGDEEIIDLNNDDYVVMDVDDFLERAEDELRREAEEAEAEEVEEPEEEVIQRDSIYSFEDHTDAVLCCAINPANHDFVLTGGQDNRSFYMNYVKPEQTKIITDHEESVCAVAFNASGELFATADMNGVIKVWRTKNCSLVIQLDGPEEVEWLKFHPKNDILFASGNDYSIWMWLLPKGTPFPLMTGHTDIVTGGYITPSGKMLVTSSLDNTLKLWQLKSQELLFSVKADEMNWHEGGLECLDVFATNSLCVSGARDGSVKLTNLKTHKILCGYKHTSKDEEENCSVEAVAFNQRYNWFASASMNGTVIIFDYQTNIIRQTLPHNGGVIRLMWHPNSIALITGCLDGCIYIWDGRTGELLQQLSGHTDMLLDMDVKVKGKKTIVTTVSDDKTCQVFRIEI